MHRRRVNPSWARYLFLVLLSHGIFGMSAIHAQSLPVFRFEAEQVSTPTDAWQTNTFSDSKWNLWSTDRDAKKKWSQGVVLQSPRVLADRSSPEAGAPPLHTTIHDLPPGNYYVEIGGVGRPIGISLDGKNWKKIERSNRNLGVLPVGPNGFEIWIDDRYASATNPGSCYYDYLEFTQLPDPQRKPKLTGYARQRVEEQLGRGVVALSTADDQVYLGWRLLREDSPEVAFNVYRRIPGKSTERLNQNLIRNTTDFVDTDPLTAEAVEYLVEPVVEGEPGERCSVMFETSRLGDRGYVSISLDQDVTFQKCGIADLNGDGVYDFVIKQPNANIDPYEKYWKPSPDTYKIEAYLGDGTRLWKHDLGWSIERGIWYSPMVVYDLDGDGRSEVCLKAGEGDPRDSDGRVQSGPEYLMILDGLTGEQRARIPWPDRNDFPSYNYASRNQMCVAYLDGKTPSLIVVRGTYNVIQVRAYEFANNELRQQWQWSDAEEGPLYRGQGAHSMHAVDVDGDGRDEIFLGSAVLDDHGVGLWSTGLGHPDHHYVGDIDPSRPGLEVYYGIETRQSQNGCCLVDARSGKIIWGWDQPTRHVHSTGMCSDIDGDVPGWECYSSDTNILKRSSDRWLFDARGQVLRSDLNWGFGPRTVYWDADPLRELIRGNHIVKYRGSEYRDSLQGSVVGFADILGDWREELIVSVPGQLRVYSTTIPAQSRRVCLMQDPLYRMDVCIQAMGYTQCPMTSP
jgi:rhamnogalacturonan endolyase